MSSLIAIAAAEAALASAHANLIRIKQIEAAKEIAGFGDMVSPVRDSSGKEHSVRFIVNPRKQRIPARQKENIHVQVLLRDYIQSHPICSPNELIQYFSEPSRRLDILQHMPEHKIQKFTLNEHLRYGVKELLRVGTLHRVLI